MPAISDVPGILVGTAGDPQALTGCTVVRAVDGAVGAVDVRGGAPGTRETDLLDPRATVNVVHAVALCGGSAFGLAAAQGAMLWLREQGIGFPTGALPVPIVPAAVIFDLAIGNAEGFADAAMGYAACAAAGAHVEEGCVGVGLGATVGKMLGPAAAMKSGVGSWSETLPDGTTVGALAVCNALGDVCNEQGTILAGARDPNGGFADTRRLLRRPELLAGLSRPTPSNTTLAIVATDAQLSKAEAGRLAQMAQTALPRVIRPVHTPFDGDSVFVLATGCRPAPPLLVLGSVAADVLAHALVRSVTEAGSAGGRPAHRDVAT
jgi:L-aminopeptidase/D-esterase-like protein